MVDTNQSATGYAGYATDPQIEQMNEYGKFLQQQKPTQPIQSWTQVASQMLNAGVGGWERSRAAQLARERDAQTSQYRIDQANAGGSPAGGVPAANPIARPPVMAPNASGFPAPGSPQSVPPPPATPPYIAGSNQNVSGVNPGGQPIAPWGAYPMPGQSGQNLMSGMFPNFGQNIGT